MWGDPVTFKYGVRVQVRRVSEILATLDERGTIDQLPFMPEMLQYCGKAFNVSRQARQICVEGANIRGLSSAVFLDDLRCDGSAHGGCDKNCALIWKTAWLNPLKSDEFFIFDGEERSDMPSTLRVMFDHGPYFCQSSNLLKATWPITRGNPRRWYQGSIAASAPPHSPAILSARSF